MPSVSIVWPPTFFNASTAAETYWSAPGPFGRIVIPGLVQNWPAPIVRDPVQPLAISCARFSNAPGITNIGFTEPSSPKNGIGVGRTAHRLKSARPPPSDPVKPTALISGCCTSASPTSRLPPWIRENTPGCVPVARTAASIACATISPVPRWAEWPLTTTGHPAASAAAVSPPAIEKASGCAEHRDRTDGTLNETDLRARLRLAIRLRGIDAAIEIVALFDVVREEPELPYRAPALAVQPRDRKSGLLSADLGDLGRSILDLVGDSAQELRPNLARGIAIAFERFLGLPACGVDNFYRADSKLMREAMSWRGLELLVRVCPFASHVVFAVRLESHVYLLQQDAKGGWPMLPFCIFYADRNSIGKVIMVRTKEIAGPITLSPAELQRWVQRILENAGLSILQSGAVSRVIAAGERDACKSHGIYRIEGILRTLKAGKVEANAVPELVPDEKPTIVRMAACKGFSNPAFEIGVSPLADRARKFGIAALAINDCTHFAALWPEIEALTELGLAAIAMCPSYSTVAPTGGKEPLFGTNPIAFGWPRPGRDPYVFDFATSVVARGEIELHRRAGKSIPEGWAIDHNGSPTRNPEAALAGALLPFGGHKGSAISTMIELLGGIMIGDLTSAESLRQLGSTNLSPSHGELVIAFSPEAFANTGGGNPFDRAERLFEAIVGQGARLPSQRRFAARREADANGIWLDQSEVESLNRMERLGLDAV